MAFSSHFFVVNSCCVDVQSTDINTDDNKSDTGTKKPHRRKKKKAMRRNVREKNLVYLTQLEKEMLDWGIGGFEPMGPASFQPTECKSANDLQAWVAKSAKIWKHS